MKPCILVGWAVVGLVVYTTSCSGAHAELDSRVVETAQGRVRGYKDPAEDVFEFLGVPYATAPVGANRYKAPLPPPSWAEIFEANNNDIICPQYLFLQTGSKQKIQEDCLIANIFVPNTADKNLPVLVNVHGGGFQIGSGSFFTPKRFVKSQKIIVVTFNYRLSIHGFLCLGTESAPGNAGLKDQVALLRWVNKNIAAFGGNPDDVTVEGYSAGSVSTDLLMISPVTNGLFKKVILESGGGISAFGMQTDPLKNAKTYASRLNVSNVDDLSVLEKFYTTATLETITRDHFMDSKDSTFLFSPCIEQDLGQEMFLKDTPYNILKSGDYEKLPMLYGFTDMEGLFRVQYFSMWKEAMNKNFSDFLSTDLEFESSNKRDSVAQEVKKFYFGENKVSDASLQAYVDFFSDNIFIYPMIRALDLHVKAGNNKVYLYEYSYAKDEATEGNHTVRGASHCAETEALYDGVMYNLSSEDSLPEDFKKVKKNMRQLWGNFVRNGVPVPDGSELPSWPAAGEGGAPHMSISADLELRGVYHPERMRLWDQIYNQYYRQPQPPTKSN